MKYKTLMAKTFNQKSDDSTRLALGVIAGLAAGAVIAVLFYSSLISRINGKGNPVPKNGEPGERGERGEHLSNGAEKDQANHHVNPAVVKKPKSDIKELVQVAHGAAHTEQGL